MWMEEHSGTRVNYARTQQALDTNASVISTACPYCLTMMEDGVKALLEHENILTRDFAELLAASVLGDGTIPSGVHTNKSEERGANREGE